MAHQLVLPVEVTAMIQYLAQLPLPAAAAARLAAMQAQHFVPD
jgi:hypothetical protein